MPLARIHIIIAAAVVAVVVAATAVTVHLGRREALAGSLGVADLAMPTSYDFVAFSGDPAKDIERLRAVLADRSVRGLAVVERRLGEAKAGTLAFLVRYVVPGPDGAVERKAVALSRTEREPGAEIGLMLCDGLRVVSEEPLRFFLRSRLGSGPAPAGLEYELGVDAASNDVSATIAELERKLAAAAEQQAGAQAAEQIRQIEARLAADRAVAEGRQREELARREASDREDAEVGKLAADMAAYAAEIGFVTEGITGHNVSRSFAEQNLPLTAEIDAVATRLRDAGEPVRQRLAGSEEQAAFAAAATRYRELVAQSVEKQQRWDEYRRRLTDPAEQERLRREEEEFRKKVAKFQAELTDRMRKRRQEEWDDQRRRQRYIILGRPSPVQR